MKYIFILLVAVFFVGCSGTKELAQQSEANYQQGNVKSYGPQGKIIYTNTETEKIESTVAFEEEIDVRELETVSTSIQTDGNIISEKEESAISTNKKVQSASSRVLAGQDWEPYRDPNRTPDKKKNGFAIAGFVLSFFYFLAPLAIIFSAIGLQSEKRGLAIAGLVISCLVAAVIIAVLIYQYI